MNTNTAKTRLSLRKGDQVQVIAGREKGKTGKVLEVNGASQTVLVEKTNLVKRHIKPSQKNPQGGIQEKEGPVAYSNVLLLCPKCNRGVRHGVKVTEGKGKNATQKKVRVCKRCDSVLDPA